MNFEQFLALSKKHPGFISAEMELRPSSYCRRKHVSVSIVGELNNVITFTVSGMEFNQCYDQAVKIINLVSSDPVL